MEIIQDFIKALEEEIKAIKSGKGGNVVSVHSGMFLRKALEFYIYQFTLESILSVVEDTPALIEIDGNDYECEIVSVSGQLIQISLSEYLGEIIHAAKIKTNLWYLLEILRKKYEENKDNEKLFVNSFKLFNGDSNKINGGDSKCAFTISPNSFDSNDSQKKAILSSLNNSISIIWGPPGTGKTHTIARAIESHLNLNRKVLLLSHANNAVDQALEKVAEQTKANFYKECKLLRYGVPKVEMLNVLESKYPLVLIEKIIEYKSKELIQNKEKYLEELNRSLHKIKITNIILNELDEIEKSKEYIKQLKSEIAKYSQIISGLDQNCENTKEKINILKSKEEKIKNYGVLKKILFDTNLNEIQRAINRLYSTLESNLKDVQRYKNIKIEKENELQGLEKKLNYKLNLIKEKAKKEVSRKEIENVLNYYEKMRQSIELKIDEINKKIEQIKNTVLSEAGLIATTLTKSYTSKEIDNLSFDIIIVDEVSMSPLPMLFWAASKAKIGITIVGDFKQLPPICISNDMFARKWLQRNIFNVLEIDEVSKATPDKLNLLDTQYRMHPLISEIPRKLIYKERLKDSPETKNKIFADEISGENTLCLVDTSSHNPWCSQFDRGRFNLISALIGISIAEKIIPSLDEHSTIGIIAPYRKQANLILKIAQDKNLLKHNNLRVDTVHSFQGGEETVIIFDCVEGIGAKKWSMINEYDNSDSAELLLNVALTRTEKKLYIVGNDRFITQYFQKDALLMSILQHFKQRGTVITSSKFYDSFNDENFSSWFEKIYPPENGTIPHGATFTEKDFWPSFMRDLYNLNEELIIFCPFLASGRVGKLSNIFKYLITKSKRIFIITLPPNQQPKIFKQDINSVIRHLKSIGVTVKFRERMHEKIAIIDRRIKWFGSLNILSHNDRKEYMERFVGEHLAKEIFDKFDLDKLLIKENLICELCPACKERGQENYITLKRQRFGKHAEFYGCTGYPKCNWTRNVDDKQSKRHKSNKKEQDQFNFQNDQG
ncbi:MAG: AAA domain-containing protein [Candidatus Thorarchaeota archaeon]